MVEQPKVIKTCCSIHSGAITVLGHHTLSGSHSETVLATGGTEGSVKVWDLTSQYTTSKPPAQSAPPSPFHYHKLLLYGGFSTDGLFCWDLTNSKLVQSMEAHFSVLTAFSITPCGLKGVSSGRDAMCVVTWCGT